MTDDTNRTMADIASAEVAEGMGGSDNWLLRFGKNDYELVPKTGLNTLLVKKDAIDPDTTEYSVGQATVSMDFDAGEYTIEVDGESVSVPAEKHENLLWALYDDDEQRLLDMHDELYEQTARVGLLDMLMPRFRDTGTSISKQENGWLVGQDALVRWNGENHVVDVDVHEVNGSDTVPADDEKPARGIDFDFPDEREVVLPNGQTTELEDVEMEFLTTVGILTDRDALTDVYDDALAHAIEASTVTSFTSPTSGLWHNHGTGKHVVTDLGVTEDAAGMLWSEPNDHLAVHELLKRRDEFVSAPVDVFENAPDSSDEKWEKISRVSDKAPIPDKVKNELDEMY